MRMPVRRALLAATVTALTLPSAASAACMPVCHDVAYNAVAAAMTTVKCLPICPDEAYARMQALLDEHEGDADAFYCAYGKLTGSPPPGWSGGGNQAPYFWVETKEWGDQNEGEYHLQVCVPSCEVDNSPMPGWGEPDLSGSLNAIGRAAQKCAAQQPL